MFKRFKNAPWRKVFRVLGWLALTVTLLIGVPSAVMEFPRRGLEGVAIHLLISAAVGLIFALQGLLMFTVIWVTHDVPKEWAQTKKFFRELPENWRRFRAGVRAVLLFLWRVPGNCLRGLSAAYQWITSLPGQWRALDRGERSNLLWAVIVVAFMGTTMYFVWPIAAAIQSMAWVPWQTPLTRLVATLVTTVIVSLLLLVIASCALAALVQWFRNTFGHGPR